jgi:thiol-disulfide isomerase/thioredoxin
MSKSTPSNLIRATLLCLSALLASGCGVIDAAISAAREGERAAPTVPQDTTENSGATVVSSLPDRGAAPEIRSNAWLNSDRPLRLADLRGQVVLLEFWTFDCINCVRTLPYVERWHQTYAAQGLTVIGVHYPEFYYERDLQNVRAAAGRLNVSYAIGIDNDGQTWRSWGQRYWPTIYLIDKRGHIRYMHIGEGAYGRTEGYIQDLLRETYTPDTAITTANLTYLTPSVDLNVRAGPGTGYDLIGAVNPGMAFVPLGGEDGWHQIAYNDGFGYVSGEYVTLHP